jgi:hypothetical protein
MELYFFQSGQEGKVIIRLFVATKEDRRDAVGISITAIYLERLDTGELPKEFKPQGVIQPDIGGDPNLVEGEMEFLRGDKPRRERVAQ